MTRVAIQGIDGSYSAEAARKLLGGEVLLVECHDFEKTFGAVTLGDADYAVVPVSNKIVGEIRQTAELLKKSPVRVREQLDVKVGHVLVGTPDSTFSRLASVRSHVEALRQCRRFLDANAGLRRQVGSDTASSIRRVVDEGDPTKAAIGSRRAAEMFGGKVLREGIADDPDNWTTFYLLGS